jgi:hypothetical protein
LAVRRIEDSAHRVWSKRCHDRSRRLQAKLVRAKAPGSDDEIAILRGLSLLDLFRAQYRDRGHRRDRPTRHLRYHLVRNRAEAWCMEGGPQEQGAHPPHRDLDAVRGRRDASRLIYGIWDRRVALHRRLPLSAQSRRFRLRGHMAKYERGICLALRNSGPAVPG